MLNEKISGKLLFSLCIILLLLPCIYILIGQFLGSVNNQSLILETSVGKSHVVDAMARMIERETASGFCPSSYVWPGHVRHDICGFQEGEQQIWQRVAMELSDHLTREGPSSDRDPDLNVVLANINRPNTWSLFFASNNTSSLLKSTVVRLDDYNARLKEKKAGYYPRIDNLSSLVGDLTSVLGGESMRLAEKAANTGVYSMQGRSAYFHTLGTMAASCWVLQAAKKDFDDVLKLQSAETIYEQAMDKTCEKLNKDPFLVINGSDLSSLLTLSGSAAAAVNNLTSLQNAIAAASRSSH